MSDQRTHDARAAASAPPLDHRLRRWSAATPTSRTAPRRRSSCSSTSRSSSPSARPARRRRTCSSSGTGARDPRRSRSRCSPSAGRGSTTRGSPRPTTTTTSSSGSRRWSRCSACSCSRSACPRLPVDRRGRALDNGVVVAGTSSCASRRSRSGCAPRGTTRAPTDRAHVRGRRLDRPGRLDGLHLRQPAARPTCLVLFVLLIASSSSAR